MTEARPRVYVVDDDPGIRESLCFLFEDAGYEVVEAADGVAALNLLRGDPRPCVLLVDRMMPRLDGVGTLRRLREETPELRRRVVALFMTARNDPPDREVADFVRQSTFATISKPFDLDALLEMVDRAWAWLAGRAAETYDTE